MQSVEMNSHLKDISNEQYHRNDIFQRLSSPTKKNGKKFTENLKKSPLRVPITQKTSIQHTPKKLNSPNCLRDYVSRMTVSIDRAQLHPDNNAKLEKVGKVTKLTFPTSPIKVRFSNDNKTVGGDGSMNRIRSKFRNGLMSPDRLAMSEINKPTSSKSTTLLSGRNLISALENEDQIDLAHQYLANNDLLKSDNLMNKQPKKKVTFKLDNEPTLQVVRKELDNIKCSISSLLHKQHQLEKRLSLLEEKELKN